MCLLREATRTSFHAIGNIPIVTLPKDQEDYLLTLLRTEFNSKQFHPHYQSFVYLGTSNSEPVIFVMVLTDDLELNQCFEAKIQAFIAAGRAGKRAGEEHFLQSFASVLEATHNAIRRIKNRNPVPI
jgi:hypothetical protein